MSIVLLSLLFFSSNCIDGVAGIISFRETINYNLQDFYHSESKGIGLDTSVGKQSTNDAKSHYSPNGATTISLKNQGEEREQQTKATLGKGEINVGGILNPEDILSSLNREVNSSQVITKDMTTGALDGSFSIDNRAFTKAGRAEIKKNISDLGKNLHQMGRNFKNDAVTQVLKAVLGEGNYGFIEATKEYLAIDKEQKQLQQKLSGLVNELNNLLDGEHDPAKVQAVLQELVNYAAQDAGFKGEMNLTMTDGNIAGLAYRDKNGQEQRISINLTNVDMSKTEEIIKVIYHETTKATLHDSDESYAKVRGDMAAATWDVRNFGNESHNNLSQDEWNQLYNNNPIIQDGNNQLISDLINASNGKGIANFEFAQAARDVGTNSEIWKFSGDHTMDIFIPDHPEDFTPEKFAAKGIKYIPPVDLGNGRKGWIMSAFKDDNGNLVAHFNDGLDQQALRNYYNNGGKSTGFPNDHDVEVKIVQPREGITDTELGYAAIRKTQAYQRNTEVIPLKYSLNPAFSEDGYNCNSFSNALLHEAGANLLQPNDFKGMDWGKYNPVPSQIFSVQPNKFIDNIILPEDIIPVIKH